MYPHHDILHHLKLSGLLYCKSELRGSWGILLPSLPRTSMFHIVLTGSCLLEHGGQQLELKAGDFVFVPRGQGQIFKSDQAAQVVDLFDLPCQQISEYYETLSIGDEGPVTLVLCGVMRLEHPSAEYLLQSIPDLIYLAKDSQDYPDWLNSTVQMMAAEFESPQLGGETLLTRLADVLVIQALRHWIKQSSPNQGWLRALHDQRIGPALSLIHSQPAQNWTLESLGQAVGMSRSAFANRFSELLGEPMLPYLTRWRMRLAAMRMLQGEKLTLTFAEQLGYSSEAAFRRAFKKAMGQTISEHLKSLTQPLALA